MATAGFPVTQDTAGGEVRLIFSTILSSFCCTSEFPEIFAQSAKPVQMAGDALQSVRFVFGKHSYVSPG